MRHSWRRRVRQHSESIDRREIVYLHDGRGNQRVLTCDEHKHLVVQPRMAAIDAMPSEYRALTHELGTFVLEAFRAGWSVERIRKKAIDAGLL